MGPGTNNRFAFWFQATATISLFSLSSTATQPFTLCLTLHSLSARHQWPPPVSSLKTPSSPPTQNPKIQNPKPQTPDLNPTLPPRLLPPVQPPPRPLRPYPRVVVVTSGKVGVGKTTTANLGLSLARLGLSVAALDADLGLRSLDLLLGLESRVNFTALDVLNGLCRVDQALVRDKRFPSSSLLCISKPRSKRPVNFGTKTLLWIVDALQAHNFILIDYPAGIDAGFITAIAPANEAIVIATPDITALWDADRVIGLLECDGIKDIKMIVNRVRTDLTPLLISPPSGTPTGLSGFSSVMGSRISR